MIYELHVKGFTQLHPDVPPEWRGKYLALTVPAVLDHLKSLGVTAVELMPVHAFTSEGFLHERGLTNYWGYNTLAWFAPTSRYAVKDPVVELKQAVKALHKAGIEVILDVVYNHTAEGNELGPDAESCRASTTALTTSIAPTTGASTTTSPAAATRSPATIPSCRPTSCASLRYFAEEFRIDGFRFDLATVLGRDRSGFNSQLAVLLDAGRRPGAGLREAHRRALGRGPRRLSARQLSRRAGASGTTAIATPCARSGTAAGACSADSRNASPARRDLFRRNGRKPDRQHQLHRRA